MKVLSRNSGYVVQGFVYRHNSVPAIPLGMKTILTKPHSFSFRNRKKHVLHTHFFPVDDKIGNKNKITVKNGSYNICIIFQGSHTIVLCEKQSKIKCLFIDNQEFTQV